MSGTAPNYSALVPEQISNEIINLTEQNSVFLSLAKAMPRMTAKQMKIPVASGLISANWVSGDYGRKPKSEMTWDNVYITAEELAVMVPVPEAVLDDSNYDIWGEIKPRIAEAFAKAIDGAVFFGTNKPTSFPTGIVPAAVAASNSVTEGDSLYLDICGENGVMSKVEAAGLACNGFVSNYGIRSKLRGCIDDNGQPIFRTAYSNGAASAMSYTLDGQPVQFVNNGAWDSSEALLVAGNFDLARYAIRQDVTYKIFEQGTITDGTGKVVLSAMENDAVILRAVMRLGWALPKPALAEAGGTSYYPFAVLKSAGA